MYEVLEPLLLDELVMETPPELVALQLMSFARELLPTLQLTEWLLP